MTSAHAPDGGREEIRGAGSSEAVSGAQKAAVAPGGGIRVDGHSEDPHDEGVSNPAEPVPDPAEVAELMFGWMHRARRLVDGRLAEVNLSLPRMKMLGRLRGGSCQQSQLAGAFDLAPRTVTEIIDGLEKAGLVERVIDPHDRRARQVHLTEAGIQAHDRGLAMKHEITAELMGALDGEQLRQLAGLFHCLQSELGATAPQH